MSANGSHLASWNDTPTRAAIEAFVESVTQEGGPSYLPPVERIAVFDNDGTLWSEKPMPIQLMFTLVRLAEMAETNPSLQEKQPWKAAYEKDYQWLSDVVVQHYHGDETNVRILMGGMLQAFAGLTVDEYGDRAGTFLSNTTHPLLKRPITRSGYLPMVELLRYLEANGFTTYIASGGDRDFMRQIAWDMYGIPNERIIGSSNGLKYIPDEQGGNVQYLAEPDVFDDGPVKPVRIWSRIGARPVFAGGNSNGDIPMLDYAGGPGRPAFRLLVLHDDKEREFDYVAGAEESLKLADADGWTVVSIKNDWRVVFAE
jgi:phosphoserine phosphatase